MLPTCNTFAMNLHLAEIAKHVAPGAHALLLVDQAGYVDDSVSGSPSRAPLHCL